MTNADCYANFAALEASEREGIDYRIIRKVRPSSVAVIAPHGGHIEHDTSMLARRIACRDHSLYCFEGLRQGRRHCELHITSHLFDEPQCVELVESSSVVLAVHGRKNGTDPNDIWIGGGGKTLKQMIAASLKLAGFTVNLDGHGLPGTHPKNICNRGQGGQGGAQLELPSAFRLRLRRNQVDRRAFVRAIRRALHERVNALGG